jgi:HEAT repeat protein
VAALAVQIIGQVRDRGAIDQLIYLTAYRDAQAGQMPAEIRLGAAMSLARMGKTEGTFIVNEYAGSTMPVLRAQAALAYGQIGRTENLPRLEQMLNDPEGITRVAAAAGVLKTGSAVAGHSGGM